MTFRDWSLLRFYLIWIYRGSPAARKATQPTDPGKAWLIEKGSVRMEVKGRETIVRAGQWVFPPAYLNEREFSEDAEILSVRFRIRWPNGKDVFQYEQPVVSSKNDLKELSEIANRLNQRVSSVSGKEGKEVHFKHCSLSDYMAIEGLMARWIALYVDCLIQHKIEPSTPESQDVLIEEVRRRIEALPPGMVMDRQILAESMAMSVSHMESRFTRQFGKTPTQYWGEMRLQRAKEMLESSNGPIKQVAFALGFKTVAHFSTWFSQHAGQSPSKFIKK